MHVFSIHIHFICKYFHVRLIFIRMNSDYRIKLFLLHKYFLLHVTVEHIIVLPGNNALMSYKEHNLVFWVRNLNACRVSVVKCQVYENFSQMHCFSRLTHRWRKELSRTVTTEREREREREYQTCCNAELQLLWFYFN